MKSLVLSMYLFDFSTFFGVLFLSLLIQYLTLFHFSYFPFLPTMPCNSVPMECYLKRNSKLLLSVLLLLYFFHPLYFYITQMIYHTTSFHSFFLLHLCDIHLPFLVSYLLVVLTTLYPL